MIELRAITIVSGGQTGADRAALDFAIEHGLAHDGWCPRGRLAEDGVISSRYQLRETPSRRYAQRTEWNVRDSDATVLFTIGPRVQGGTALTRDLAERLGRPWLHLARDAAVDEHAATEASAIQLLAFLAEHEIKRLNVAGPRASQEPNVANFVDQALSTAIRLRKL